MSNKSNKSNKKAYRKEYYQKNKEKLKAYSKERYAELKAKNVNSAVNENQNTPNAGFFTITGDRASSGVDSNNILGQFVSWVYTCCTINGNNVASQNLRLYATTSEGQDTKFLHKNRPITKEFDNYIRNDSSVKSLARIRKAENIVEIIDHPALDLLEQVNPNSNNFESFELTSIYLDMIGDSYWYIPTDKFGVPLSIDVLQSQHMKIVPGKTSANKIKGYLYGKGRDLIKFNNKEIIHFKTPNPLDIYYGRGAAQSVITSINRLNSMDVSEQARLDNMGRPDFVVNYKGKIDSQEINKLEKMWNSTFGGTGKAGKIKVMDEDYNLQTLGFAPKDMEYLSGRVWSLKDIAAAFGIPYSILDTSDTKKATSELANYWYSKNAILPRITRLAEKLTEKLLPMYDDSRRMFFMYDSPIPEDRKSLMEENTRYVQTGIITVNEARLRMGLEALGEEYDIPSSNQTITEDINVDNSDNSDNSDSEENQEEE